MCLQYPGIKCMIVRKTYPELTENHINPMCEMLKCFHPDKNERIASYNDSKKNITFQNGSRILFRYCDTEKDADRFQGTEVDCLFIDEATQQSEEKFKKLSACVRGVNDFPKRVYLPCNPGGEGHAWVKRLFVDRRYEANEKAEDYVFIKSRVTDNKVLLESQPDYIEQLEALPPRLRKMWLEGDWEFYDGQFFEDFRTEPDAIKCKEAGITIEEAKERGCWTHVIKPFDISAGDKRSWKIYRSYDFGYAKPFSCAWWAIDHDGTMYRIMELYGCTANPDEGLKWSPDQQFKEIARIEREHPWFKGRQIEGIADPAIWDASRGESIADTATKYGVYFSPGDHERLAGWMQCHYRLQFDENGYARCYVFDVCKGFIRTIPLLMYDEHKPEDLDTKLEDHIADEWRYMCMSRPVTPLRPVEQKSILSDPLDQFKKRR